MNKRWLVRYHGHYKVDRPWYVWLPGATGMWNPFYLPPTRRFLTVEEAWAYIAGRLDCMKGEWVGRG